MIVSIIPYTSTEAFLLNWGGILPPVSPEVFEIRALYWIIMDYNALEPHGGNIWTLEFNTSPCFGRGSA